MRHFVVAACTLGLTVCSAWAAPTGDLVVGKIERNPQGLVIYYQNQGPGRLEGKSVSLRLSDKKELLTIDGQPLPREPLQICRTATIPYASLGMKPRDYYALTVTIDPRDEIRETKEQNNDFFQQNNAGELNEYPDFEAYKGVARLKIDSVVVVGPGQLQVKVVNTGSGITLGTYSTRLTINGVSNNLVTQHYQPVPRPGQFDSWLFRFERWGVHPGETVNLKVEVDPDRRLPGAPSSAQVYARRMQLGPTTQSTVAPARSTSGQVKTPAYNWTAKSSYICWVPSSSTLSVNFFPFKLGPNDQLGLLYNEPSRVVQDRAKRTSSPNEKGIPEGEPFAQLNFELYPGTTQLSKKNIERVSWTVGNNRGSGSIPCDVDDVDWSKAVNDIGSGKQLQLFAKSQRQKESLEIRTSGVIHECKLVPQSVGNPDLPHAIPDSSVKGMVRTSQKTFNPKSAIGFYHQKSQQLHLMLLARPIESDDMTEFKTGWLNVKKPFAPPGEIEWLSAYFDLKKPQNRTLPITLAQGRAGHGGTLSASEAGHLVILKTPKLGQGQAFSFRLRGRVHLAGLEGLNDLDLSGTATMMELR